MKRSFLIVVMFVTALASCKKDDDTQEPECIGETVTIAAPASEVQALRTYIQDNNITATEDTRGFFYTINAPGSGAKPTICSNVSVDYVGKLTNGSVFDSANDISFYLSQLIIGWQEGIPLIAPGGSITLYLPPSLAYGSQARSGIPANSNLIFNINLKTVNKY